MTSAKQLIANQQNAKASTGPVSLHGKTIVATNAVKHGIFSKDLIIPSGPGRESQLEYEELLNNLTGCLVPQNQMESLLVEKIAIDFWRLRRVLRFESGSIMRHFEKLLSDFYSYGKDTTASIDRSITHNTYYTEWNTTYIDCLRNQEVSFEAPVWKKEGIESNITEDLHIVARNIENLPKEQKTRLYAGSLGFEEVCGLLKTHGYSDQDIVQKLIEHYTKQNIRLAKEAQELKQKKAANEVADDVTRMISLIPAEENSEKIMKYERSLQKSIFQNLFLLKKLQES
ncbi:MAG: hypothetical protein KGI80_02610 [Verrucomicrobiota bacterium]|nr:hypothetical protein [Verrucomicrobiota bacterium]